MKNKSENKRKWKRGGVKKKQKKKKEWIKQTWQYISKVCVGGFKKKKNSMQFFMHLIKIEQKINLNINFACWYL